MSRGGEIPGWRGSALLVVGLVLVACNLRFALTSLGPVIDDLRADVGLSGTATGLLTTAPLLALGLVSPIAPRLARRFGAEHVVLTCLVTISAGIAVRSLAPVVLLFAGTVLAGCAIAVGNVLVPSIVKRRFAERAAFMTGVYSVGLSAGAAISAGLTVPIEHAVGDSWRLALAVWALPALLAAAIWWPQLRHRVTRSAPAVAGRDGGAGAVPADAASAVSGAGAANAVSADGAERVAPQINLWRDRRAWSVTLFMGTQSLIFYTAGAWLPEMLTAHGASDSSAGALLSLVALIGVPVGFLTAALASRMRDPRPLAVVGTVLPALAWLGLLTFPGQLTLLWVVLLGIGAGTAFTLVLTLLVLRSRDAPHTAALSGMAQSAGYTLAAAGPLLIGALHDLSGGWSLPLAVLACLGLPEVFLALAAAKPGYVGREPAAPPAGAGEQVVAA